MKSTKSCRTIFSFSDSHVIDSFESSGSRLYKSTHGKCKCRTCFRFIESMKTTIKLITVTLMLITTSFLFSTVPVAPSNYSDSDAGTSGNPYLISSLGNLRWLSETPEAWGSREQRFYFLQTVDIDATDTKNWNNGEGFRPIAMFVRDLAEVLEGEAIDTQFYGSYNGNNHTIKNIYMNYKYDGKFKFVGLFATVYSANLSNIRLENIRIYSDYRTGGLVGAAMSSTIENSSISGVITVGEKAEIVGGLVGPAANSKITACFSTVIIDGEDYVAFPEHPNPFPGSLGGLVGNMINSSLSNSFFNGEIRRIAFVSGGLVGSAANSIIENCFVTTKGGLHEIIFYWDISDMQETNPRSPDTMHVMFGAIAGNISSGSSLVNVFWDRDTTGLRRAAFWPRSKFGTADRSVRGSRGVTTAQMKRATTFTRRGWDFENIWDIDPNINDGYPFLRGARF